MMNFFKDIAAAFSKDESGAVTVDWVMLTAAVVLIGGAGIAAVGTKITAKVSGITL